MIRRFEDLCGGNPGWWRRYTHVDEERARMLFSAGFLPRTYDGNVRVQLFFIEEKGAYMWVGAPYEEFPVDVRQSA